MLSLNFPNSLGRTPATTQISFARDIPGLDLAFAGAGVGLVLFIIWSNLIVTAATNGVNLTDGLDGLAAGAAVMVFGVHADGHLAEQPGVRFAPGGRGQDLLRRP